MAQKQIGYSTEANLLVDIIRDLDRLIQVTSTSGGGGGGSGTVTSVSVTSANGLAGTVATATTTPAITLSTSITGVLKGNGTAISAATVGTDYSVGTSALATGILKSTTTTGALSIAAAGTDYLAPSGSGAALTGVYLTASGGTATGANTYTGTSTNIFKYVFDSLGTTQTNGAGQWLANTTAAAAGAQQRSPSLVFEGQGWKTTATAASQSIKFITDVLPIEGTTAPDGMYRVVSSVNSAAYSTTPHLGITTNGRFLFNTGTVTSAYGYTIKSFGTSGSTFNSVWQNSSSTVLLTLTDNGLLNVANGGGVIFQVSGIANSANSGSPGTGANAKGHVFHNLNPGALATGDAALYLTTASQAHTSGTIATVNINGSYAVSSGTGNSIQLQIRPLLNTTSTYVGNMTYIDIDPNVSSATGLTQYGILSRPAGILNGFGLGATMPTAKVHIGAGTATASTAPLKLTSGTNLTTAENGAFEYNGTNLFFTRTGAVRENVVTSSAVNSVSPTAPNRTITVVIDGTTYYLHAKTTND